MTTIKMHPCIFSRVLVKVFGRQRHLSRSFKGRIQGAKKFMKTGFSIQHVGKKKLFTTPGKHDNRVSAKIFLLLRVNFGNRDCIVRRVAGILGSPRCGSVGLVDGGMHYCSLLS